MQSTKQQEHKNTITQSEHNKLKTRFGHLLRRPAWKRSVPILEGKIRRKKEKKKEANMKSKQTQTIHV